MINYQSRKAGITFTILSFIAGIALLSLFYSINRIVEPTLTLKKTLQCCPDLVSNCLLYLAMVNSIIPWIGIGILFFGLLNGLPRLILSIAGSLRFAKRLETLKIKGAVYSRIKRLINDEELFKRIVIFDDIRTHNAFTIGLFKPMVYFSVSLCKRLKNEELKAVILHEAHHMKKHDPLRLLIVAFVCDIFFFIPLTKYLKELFISSKEKAADDAAVAASKKPLELASALIKLLRSKNDLILNPTAIWEPGSPAERIHRLINPKMDKSPDFSFLKSAISFLIVVALVGMLTLPSFAAKLPILNTTNCRSSHMLIIND
jgi:beta-lactamase regulating signal transducer with metallopeptidase domain